MSFVLSNSAPHNILDTFDRGPYAPGWGTSTSGHTWIATDPNVDWYIANDQTARIIIPDAPPSPPDPTTHTYWYGANRYHVYTSAPAFAYGDLYMTFRMPDSLVVNTSGSGYPEPRSNNVGIPSPLIQYNPSKQSGWGFQFNPTSVASQYIRGRWNFSLLGLDPEAYVKMIYLGDNLNYEATMDLYFGSEYGIRINRSTTGVLRARVWLLGSNPANPSNSSPYNNDWFMQRSPQEVEDQLRDFFKRYDLVIPRDYAGKWGFYYQKDIPNKTTEAHEIIVKNFMTKSSQASKNRTPAYPINDTFTRTRWSGWGSTSTGWAWDIHTGLFGERDTARNYTGSNPDQSAIFTTDKNDNRVYTRTVQVPGGDNYAEIYRSGPLPNSTQQIYYNSLNGLIGSKISGNVRLTVTFMVPSGWNDTANINFLLRCASTEAGAGNAAKISNAYALMVTPGSQMVRIRRYGPLNASGDEVTTIIATNTTGLTANFAQGVRYTAEFEISGTTLNGRVWRTDTQTRPVSPTVTGTSSLITGSGSSGFNLRLAGSPSNPYDFGFRVYSWEFLPIYGVNAISPDSTTPFTNNTISDQQATIKFNYVNDNNNNSTIVARYKKSNDPEELFTTSGVTTTRVTTLPKHFSIAITGLEENTDYDLEVFVMDDDGVNGTDTYSHTFKTNWNSVRLYEIHVDTVTNNKVIVSAPYDGDDNQNSTATISYSTGGGAYSPEVPVVYEHLDKEIIAEVTGLAEDTIYTFRLRIYDPEGFTDDEGATFKDLLVTTQTISKTVQLASIATIPQATTSVISVHYLYDTNNDSTLALQYKPLTSNVWTTQPPAAITADRVSKRFVTTLTMLRPNTTYEVRAIISDPDGVVYETSNTISGVVTTLGSSAVVDTKTKHYLWKVYAPSGEYLGTWNDVSIPMFQWHENGGVSDLNVTLYRPINYLREPRQTIAFQNRVDVWAYDPSSEGLGLNYILDPQAELGAWTTGAGWSIDEHASHGSGKAYIFRGSTSSALLSEFISLDSDAPIVITAMVHAHGQGAVSMRIQEYSADDTFIGYGDAITRTVGQHWQRLIMEYRVNPDAAKYRVEFVPVIEGGTFHAHVDNLSVRSKMLLIYRGNIESYTATIDQSGERIEVRVLGLISQLSDDYIEHLQFVTTQPQKDLGNELMGIPPKHNYGPTDPAEMLKLVIDVAQQQNDKFLLYYTEDSIKSTGNEVEYTFRNQLIRSCFDKIRELCPPGWHYFVAPDGLVTLRGPEHVAHHHLRLGVEILNFEVEQSIQNLKNVVHVRGRQDEDMSEADGFGTIDYVAFDQDSIDRYGRRVVYIKDSNIVDPETAQIVGDGRLEEYNRSEQRSSALIPDIKAMFITEAGQALRGYDIELFRPGDELLIFDPLTGPRNVYWDHLEWDDDSWDTTEQFAALIEPVPIKTIQYEGTSVRLQLSERQPSAVGEYGRLQRYLQLQDSNKDDL